MSRSRRNKYSRARRNSGARSWSSPSRPDSPNGRTSRPRELSPEAQGTGAHGKGALSDGHRTIVNHRKPRGRAKSKNHTSTADEATAQGCTRGQKRRRGDKGLLCESQPGEAQRGSGWPSRPKDDAGAAATVGASDGGKGGLSNAGDSEAAHEPCGHCDHVARHNRWLYLDIMHGLSFWATAVGVLPDGIGGAGPRMALAAEDMDWRREHIYIIPADHRKLTDEELKAAALPRGGQTLPRRQHEHQKCFLPMPPPPPLFSGGALGGGDAQSVVGARGPMVTVGARSSHGEVSSGGYSAGANCPPPLPPTLRQPFPGGSIGTVEKFLQISPK
ncbi:hypothetical protein MAPG_09954 [Magnaporthiopsis poae ATCC 64411]|uniref:Uncharacterized protein n=1 Tax=Magnaporthiopsis poae (strain ATCC 64411 / 73-15) TaxID=644358 RepID=A0A0C4EBA7_MAGP6|nr:hypothetical protein MAPG_09954 [Magnaporthiopsis poae ATCC 64411]